MSAYYCVAFDDRIELLTDGSVCDDRNVLVATKQKVACSRRLPLAVTGRGPNAVIDGFSRFIVSISDQEAMTFDGTLKHVEDMLRARELKAAPSPLFEMVIAGFSEAVGPTIRYFHSGIPQKECVPWRLIDVSPEAAGIPDISKDEVLSAIPLDRIERGLSTMGADLFELLRHKPGKRLDRPEEAEFYGVGSHVDLTTITATGTKTARLLTWSDVIGEKIDPQKRDAEAA